MAKVAILKAYFLTAPDEDKIWALALFTHKRPRRQVNTTLLKVWAAEASQVDPWMFDECYHVVGDLAETMALLLPGEGPGSIEGLNYWMHYILSLKEKPEADKKNNITQAWKQFTKAERLVFNKLLTSSFRLGVSQNLVTRAVAEAYEIDKAIIAHRIMGNWDPVTTSFQELVLEEQQNEDESRPYPFYLAYAIDGHPEDLGNSNDWIAEWKWDGIRSQIIVKSDTVYIWSRGEDLITEKFPELEVFTHLPNGTVIDGELLPVKNGLPLPFGLLQTRIGRKNISKKLLQDAPAAIFAYDILEFEGKDIRTVPFAERRVLLEKVVRAAANEKLLISPQVAFESWADLEEIRKDSRDMMPEGIMLKRKSSHYGVGRKKGDWWKWKVEPLTIDGVLIYAQKGHGRRADLYTDYTFGVWQDDILVPFAKAYSGLTDKEIRRVDNFVKRNTKERFGPVRTVKPDLVFEIAFEGIQESNRHKSGVAVRFPRILRWREDKPSKEADTLENLQQLLNLYGK